MVIQAVFRLDRFRFRNEILQIGAGYSSVRNEEIGKDTVSFTGRGIHNPTDRNEEPGAVENE